MNSLFRRVVLLCVGLLLGATACGGDDGVDPAPITDEITCGSGTVLAGGVCVLAEIDCPDGQVPTPAGQCADPDVYCGTGSSYDVEAEACLSDTEISCGPGTVEVGSRCVVEDAMVCGPGTVLADGECRIASSVCGPGTDLDETQCVIDPSACSGRTEFDVILGECVDVGLVECGEDTVQVGNQCRPFSTVADELAAEADVEFFQGVSLDLGSQPGDRVVFTGTMMPGSSLFHVYSTQLSEGQWVEITLYSRGLPSPGFRVRRAVGTWERRALAGLTNVPHRTILAPGSGTYDLIVDTSVSGMPGGHGSTSWEYVGVIETIEAPQPASWDLFDQTLEIDLRNTTENFFEVDLPDGEQVLFLPEALGADVDNPVVEYWTSPTTFGESFSLIEGSLVVLEHTGGGPGYLLFDTRATRGARADLMANAFETSTIASGTSVSYTVEATAGQMIFGGHRSDGATTLDGRILGVNGETLFEDEVLALNRPNYGINDGDRAFVYAPETGTYTVVFENSTSNDVQGFFATITAQDVPTLNVGTEETVEEEWTFSTDGLQRGNWQYMLIDAATAARITGRASVGSGRPDVSVYDLEGERIENFANTGVSQEFSFNLWNEGVVILVVRPFNALGGGLDVEVTAEPLTMLQPGDMLEFEFTAETFDVLVGHAGYFDGATPGLRLLNPDGVPVFDRPAIDDAVKILELLPANGEYSLQLYNDAEDPVLGAVLEGEIRPRTDSLTLEGDADVTVTQGALLEGERDVFVLRALNDLFLLVTALAGEEEGLAMTLERIDAEMPTISGAGTEEISIAAPSFQSGVYVLIVEAQTDVESYTLTFEGTEIFLVQGSREHDPPLFIEPTGDATGIETSEIVISGCPFVAEVKVTVDFSAGLKSFMYWDLQGPDGTTVRVNDRSAGAITNPIVFPDTMEPDESLDAFESRLGDGTWTLILDNQASFTDAFLDAWSLELVCGGN